MFAVWSFLVLVVAGVFVAMVVADRRVVDGPTPGAPRRAFVGSALPLVPCLSRSQVRFASRFRRISDPAPVRCTGAGCNRSGCPWAGLPFRPGGDNDLFGRQSPVCAPPPVVPVAQSVVRADPPRYDA